jgi:hypothetical protein
MKVSIVVDIQTVSIAIASAGVFAAAIYYILQIRNQTRIRKTDLLVRLFSMTMTKDFGEAWEKVLGEREILEYRAYWKKYGFVEVDEVFWFFEQLGRLLQKRLIDIELTTNTLWTSQGRMGKNDANSNRSKGIFQ